ncbi:MATE efflux family protein [Chiua virens]|nr:MATE efflux family protein [Chiua virens]
MPHISDNRSYSLKQDADSAHLTTCNEHSLQDTESKRLLPSTPSASISNDFFASTVPAKKTSIKSGSHASRAETAPLLAPAVPHIDPRIDHASQSHDDFMSNFWDEIKTLVAYALPVLGTQVFEQSIFMASVISIGHISTIALAAATLGFMTANISGLSMIQGMTNALDTLLPSAWTSDQPQLVGLWTQRMAVLQLIALIPIYIIWLNGESLLLALRQEPEVAKLAGIYLKWASFGLPAYSFNCISRRYFQAQGLFDMPARIILFVAPVNALLSYLLVWGPKYIRLGFIGAPIATAISFNLISIASLIYAMYFVEGTAWCPISTRSLSSLGSLARLSVASVVQFASERWYWELVGFSASFLGSVQLAAQSVLLTTTACTFQVPYALGIATSCRIGNLLGAKKANCARVSAIAALLISFVFASLLSGLFMTFRDSWGYIFNDDPEVVALVAAVLPLVALVQACDDSGAVISGILRVRGKQTLGAMIYISAYYFIGCPIGFWLTFKEHWGLFGLWWSINIAMVWAVSIGMYFCVTTDWQEEVEKGIARLAVDNGYQQRLSEEYPC